MFVNEDRDNTYLPKKLISQRPVNSIIIKLWYTKTRDAEAQPGKRKSERKKGAE